MSIPKWRMVRYDDDGCCLYQCLNCYEQWSGRGAPGDTWEGVYHEYWKFCPCCGIRWEGSQRERSDRFGPRRQRAYDAEWERESEEPLADYWFVVEQQEIRDLYCSGKVQTHSWVPVWRYRGLMTPASKVLEHARERAESENRFCQDLSKVNVRVKVVRDLSTYQNSYRINERT